MEIDTSLLKFYAPASTLGGEINLASLQTSSLVGNEISSISTLERSTGTMRYVKQFLRNESPDAFGLCKVYLSARTQYSPNTGIAFALSGSKSRLTTASALSGTAVITATGYITTSSDLRLEVACGERVFNSTDDLVTYSVEVSEVASTYIQLNAAYIGTIGAGKTISVAPATMSTFISPVSADDPVSPSVSIATLDSIGVWKRYEVFAGCPAFENDWFTLTFEEVS